MGKAITKVKVIRYVEGAKPRTNVYGYSEVPAILAALALIKAERASRKIDRPYLAYVNAAIALLAALEDDYDISAYETALAKLSKAVAYNKRLGA